MNYFFTTTDFEKILDEFGREIIQVPINRTISNLSGNETLTAGTPAVIEAYFIRTNQKWDYEKAGLLEVGDAILLSKYSDAVEKDDLIYADGVNVEISSIDGGTAFINVTTSTAHGLTAGTSALILGTTNYDGVYTVTSITNGTSFIITDASHDKAEETAGQINRSYNKFRIKEAYHVPGTFSNTGGGTTFTYTYASLFLHDEG